MTDFNDCVTVYGTDAVLENTAKGPNTKFQFHINTDERLIDLVDQVITRQGNGTATMDEEEIVLKALRMPVKRFFFELELTCKDARKWGCSENFIVEK